MNSLVSTRYRNISASFDIPQLTPPTCLDAQWYTKDEVRAVLAHPIGGNFGKTDFKKMAEGTEGRDNENPDANLGAEPVAKDDPPFRLPPVTAIAGVLIRDWVDGKIKFGGDPRIDSPKACSL